MFAPRVSLPRWLLLLVPLWACADKGGPDGDGTDPGPTDGGGDGGTDTDGGIGDGETVEDGGGTESGLPCDDVSLNIYEDHIKELPTTRYGDIAIRSCRYWEPSSVAIKSRTGTGLGALFVGGYHFKDTDAHGNYSELAYSGDVLQMPVDDDLVGVLLESDLMTADIRPDHCGDQLGRVGTSIADLDGDFIPDLLAGSATAWESAAEGLCLKPYPPPYNVGAWVVPGPFSGDIIAEDVGWFAGYPWDEISFWNGIPVVVGDVTGDGQTDIALPLEGDGLGTSESGEVALLPGPFEPGDFVDLSAHEFVFQGGSHSHVKMPTVAEDYDANGDGFVDLAMSHGTAGPFPGVSIYLGPVDSASTYGEPDMQVGTPGIPFRETEGRFWEMYGYWGHPLLNAGDMNGDGRDDLVVTAFDRNFGTLINAGLVWIVESELDLGLSDLDVVASARIEGQYDNAFAGWPVSAGGDLDGDGHTDLVVGSNHDWISSDYKPAPFNKDPGTWLHYGPLSGTVALQEGTVVHANRTGLMASDGDLDGDGIDDLVMTDWDPENDGYAMGDAVHVWLSGQSLEFPRPWAPLDKRGPE